LDFVIALVVDAWYHVEKLSVFSFD